MQTKNDQQIGQHIEYICSYYTVCLYTLHSCRNGDFPPEQCQDSDACQRNTSAHLDLILSLGPVK